MVENKQVTPEQVTGLILKIKLKYPNLRIGQIISNVMRLHNKNSIPHVITGDPYFIHEKELYIGLLELEKILDESNKHE